MSYIQRMLKTVAVVGLFLLFCTEETRAQSSSSVQWSCSLSYNSTYLFKRGTAPLILCNGTYRIGATCADEFFTNLFLEGDFGVLASLSFVTDPSTLLRVSGAYVIGGMINPNSSGIDYIADYGTGSYVKPGSYFTMSATGVKESEGNFSQNYLSCRFRPIVN